MLQEGPELFPKGADGKFLYADADYVDTWKAMEEVARKGLTKSIGISNFNRKQIERVLESASIVPATNQVNKRNLRNSIGGKLKIFKHV